MKDHTYNCSVKRWMLVIGFQTDQAVEYMEWDKLYKIFIGLYWGEPERAPH